MIPTHSSVNNHSLHSGDQIKVWVLAPSIESTDDHIDYYYDFSQSIAEYTRVFEQLQLPWQWQPVTTKNFIHVIENIDKEKERGQYLPVVLNLCDGDEVNGTPGISVIRLLEEKEIIYTGADEFFYHVTTSKIPMKQAFDKAHVANAAWEAINSENINGNDLFTKIGCPLIVKPAVSGGSMGVGIKNVVETNEALSLLLKQMFEGYRGWNLTADGIVAEQFISGPEYTVFICGSFDNPDQAEIYTPVERVFHASLPEKEQFLSFDRLWEIYEEETAMPGEENFYEYCLPPENLIDPLKKLSWEAFCATKGKGYTRVDIRMDAVTKKLYVLEVNAQCGISEDENYTSIGAILRFSGKSFSSLIEKIILDALHRAAVKKQSYINRGNNARA